MAVGPETVERPHEDVAAIGLDRVEQGPAVEPLQMAEEIERRGDALDRHAA
jgi:hypothetical protein